MNMLKKAKNFPSKMIAVLLVLIFTLVPSLQTLATSQEPIFVDPVFEVDITGLSAEEIESLLHGDIPVSEVQARNSLIKSVGASLGKVNSTKVECTGTITGYSSLVKKVSIYVYLERYSSGTWSTYNGNSWYKTENDYYASKTGTATVGAGTYRVRVSAYAYPASGSGENLTKTSGSSTF